MFSPNSPKLPKRVRALSKIIGVPNTLDLLDAIGTYKQIGAGASGKVYALKNKGRTFVIKTGSIPAREKRISNYLSNKTDVVPSQYGSGKQYQIMEKLEGVPLQKCLNPDRNKDLLEQVFPNVKFDKETQTKITKRIIKAYSVIHKLGIAHSDIHTGNIFVTAPDLKIKIIDFGISQEGFRYVLEEILYGPSPDEANLDYSYINGIVSDSAFAENIVNPSPLFPKTITDIFKRELHKFWIEDICKPLGIDFQSIRTKVNNGVDVIEEIYENPGSEFKKIDNYLKELSNEEGLKLVNKFYDSLLNALGSDGGNVTAKSNILKKFAKGGIVSSPTLSLVGEANKKEFIFKTKNIGLNLTNLEEPTYSNIHKPKQKIDVEEVDDYSILYKKFVKRVDKFFTSTNRILNLFSKNTRKIIQTKKELFELERTDRRLSERETKKVEQEFEDSKKKKKKRPTISLGEDAGYLALALFGIITNRPETSQTEVYGNVVSRGDFSVDTSGANTTLAPAWVPFPKGTPGLVFTSGFGRRRGHNHSGIDIAGPTGSPIITPISGVVERAGNSNDGFGNSVIITSGPLKMLFGHMYQQPEVRVGQRVVAGTKLGGIGSTGSSTGPHLHWNVYVNGQLVNPAQWTTTNAPQTSVQSSTSSHSNQSGNRNLDNKAEGGIKYPSNIMVGEAGKELVIPISQMKTFMMGMVDEKIKSLIPFYVGERGSKEYGVKKISGIASKKYASGGLVGAEDMITHYEALGAYIPNTGGVGRLSDFINVADGGVVSTISNTPKSKAFNLTTNLYAYADSKGLPTIGFGTTFMGKLYGAKDQAQPVNMGTQMSVGKAYDIMRKQIKEIDERHTKDFPKVWKYIPDKAKAGLISYLYNRGPYVFYDPSDPLHWLLLKGNMPGIAAIVRGDTGGVGSKRRNAEANAIRSGGMVKEPKRPPTTKTKTPKPLVTADCKIGRRPTNIIEAIQQGVQLGFCQPKKGKELAFNQSTTQSSSAQLNNSNYDMHNSAIQFANNFDFDKRTSQDNTIYFVQDTIKGVIT